MKKRGIVTRIASRLERNRLGELLVLKGRISTAQLHEALKAQKGSGLALGQVLEQQGLVTRTQIRTTLFEQAACRVLATSLSIFISFSAMQAGAAKASSLTPRTQVSQPLAQQGLVHKVAYQPRAAIKRHQSEESQALFGTREVQSRDISAFTKWTGILGRLDKVSFAPEKMQRFEGLSFIEKVVAVNDYVNKVRYIEDSKNFGKSDYWATPAEFFARGGDCEDFAIAKYALLKQAGVPESMMRLAIVQDKIKNIPHAVLIVYTPEGPMLLDNQIKKTSKVATIDRYKPIYSINATGWWRHLG